MKLKRRFALLGMCGLLALHAACTRSDVSVPSPTGPSTLALTFDLEAIPNVVVAASEKSMATIKGTLRKAGLPLANRTIYFSILSGPGEFSDYSQRVAVQTDSTGVAMAVFVGPTNLEIGGDTDTLIKGQPETITPDYVHKTIDIRILKKAD